MTDPVRILAFSGSSRRGSLNGKFLAVAAREAQGAGCEVTVADLGSLELPIFNGDLEDASGIPEAASRLAGLVASHHGLLVASPEYNAMPTPLLKNALDWCSRVEPNPFEGRVAAVISASPGVLGGARSMVLAQQLLTRLGCLVVPGQCILPGASKAFDPEGRLLSERSLASVRDLVGRLSQLASLLAR